MARLQSTVLTLAGCLILFYGAAMLLAPVRNVYEQMAASPLEEPISNQKYRDEVIRGVMIGALGVPLLIAGAVIRRRDRARRARP